MKILYVGGMYQLEYSLHCELMNNPNLSGFGCTAGEIGCEMRNEKGVVNLTGMSHLEEVRKQLNPDMCIFRTWCTSTPWSRKEDVLLSYEIMPTKSDGSKYPGGLSATFPGRIVGYQSQPMAKANGCHWLPYCVSKHYEKQSSIKGIPVLVATNMPSELVVGDNKTRSVFILLSGIVKHDASLVHAHIINDFDDSGSILKNCLRPVIAPNQMIDYISRAKIWVSPTSVWYDEGCLSHKTVQGMGCGTLTITNKYPGIEDILGKDGEYLLYANTPEESLDKIKYYLEHDVEREAIAQRGYDFVHGEYGWEKQLNRLYKEIHA